MTRTAEDNRLEQLTASFDDAEMRAALGRITDPKVRMRMIELLRLTENAGGIDPSANEAFEMISRLLPS